MKISVAWFQQQEHLPGLTASAMVRAVEGVDLEFKAGLLEVSKGSELVALVPVGNIRWMQPAPKTKV